MPHNDAPIAIGVMPAGLPPAGKLSQTKAAR